MFDIGWSEIMVIAVVAIVVIGPKDLPRAMRTVGRWSGKMKRMGREFQNQFNEAIREAELDDVKKQVTDLAKIDPMADLKSDLAKTESDIRGGLTQPAANGVAAPATNAKDAELAAIAADKSVEEPAPEGIAVKPAPAIAPVTPQPVAEKAP
jgi:sec-independent protein translocase protein TatB